MSLRHGAGNANTSTRNVPEIPNTDQTAQRLGYWLHDSGKFKARFPAGPILTFTCTDWLSSSPVPYPIDVGGIIYLGIRQPERQANYSPQFGAEVKNEWS